MAKVGGTVQWTRNIGNVMIKEIDVEIGGQRIDRQFGDWMVIWNEIAQHAEKEDGYNNMIGNTTTLTTAAASIPTDRLYIPLVFWFNRNPGLALPLIALQYHEVKVNLEFRPAAECFISDDGSNPDGGLPSLNGGASLYVDYIYLDTDERRRFAQVSHEYLIEQVQFTGAESFSVTSNKPKLNFNHPVKFLVWTIQLDSNVATNVNRWSDYTDGSTPYAGLDTVDTAKLQLNGHDRFSVRQGPYFNLVQPYQHMTRIPAVGIYVYSFALNPLEHQPSGTVNMSRIDNASLLIDTTLGAVASKFRIYAVNYNVLRIMSGMGGLAYSN